MQNLTRASEELFSRSEDERCETLPELVRHCHDQQQESADRWLLPGEVCPEATEQGLQLRLGSEGHFQLNDWGFSQMCRLAGVAKETVNRLSPDTAARVLGETLPGGRKAPTASMTLTSTASPTPIGNFTEPPLGNSISTGEAVREMGKNFGSANSANVGILPSSLTESGMPLRSRWAHR